MRLELFVFDKDADCDYEIDAFYERVRHMSFKDLIRESMHHSNIIIYFDQFALQTLKDEYQQDCRFLAVFGIPPIESWDELWEEVLTDLMKLRSNGVEVRFFEEEDE